jgi:hypothetical protein
VPSMIVGSVGLLKIASITSEYFSSLDISILNVQQLSSYWQRNINIICQQTGLWLLDCYMRWSHTRKIMSQLFLQGFDPGYGSHWSFLGFGREISLLLFKIWEGDGLSPAKDDRLLAVVILRLKHSREGVSHVWVCNSGGQSRSVFRPGSDSAQLVLTYHLKGSK